MWVLSYSYGPNSLKMYQIFFQSCVWWLWIFLLSLWRKPSTRVVWQWLQYILRGIESCLKLILFRLFFNRRANFWFLIILKLSFPIIYIPFLKANNHNKIIDFPKSQTWILFWDTQMNWLMSTMLVCLFSSVGRAFAS